jgi:hypothetical protein
MELKQRVVSVKAILRQQLHSFLFADDDEATGAADATAWMSRESSGAADIVWA